MDYVIIVAGGKGLRMGSDIPKQFMTIGGKPILMHTMTRFHEYDPNMGMIVVLPHDQQDTWKQLCKEYHFDIPHEVVDGGDTRFASSKNGLAAIPDDAEGVVGIHDGVRPFISKETIQRCYAAAAGGRAVVPVVPVVETIRQILPDGKSITRPRDEYRLVQTPQTFPLVMLKKAYEQSYSETFTDDASVVEAMGEEILMVEGNRENIKITTPSDLK